MTRPLLLNHQQAAALLGVSVRQLYTLRAAGALVGCEGPIPGKWSRERLEQWARGEDRAQAARRALRRTA